MNNHVLPYVGFEPGLTYKVVSPIYSLGIDSFVKCVMRNDRMVKFEVIASKYISANQRFSATLDFARQCLRYSSESDQALFAEAQLARLTDDIAKGLVAETYLRFLHQSIRLGFAAETDQAIRAETALATHVAVRKDVEIFGGIYE